jgi:hypothetical protein
MSNKKLAGVIAGCIVVAVVIVVIATSRQALPRPMIDIPTNSNWGLFSLTRYEEGIYEGEYDDQAGVIEYVNQVTYDSIQIFYERAPNWDLTPSALEQDADNIFQRDIGYMPDETGIMTIAGTTAGYAKGYDSDFDMYDLELVLVLDHVYVDVYALYTSPEVEYQILDMIDSISL